jgi:cell wall-associated NlpC family hydrolase
VLGLAAAAGLVAATGVPAFAHPAVHHEAATTTCASLGSGATGAAVANIQKRLKVAADGDFGPQTAAALKKWQTAHHVPATGVVDARTWAKLPAKASRRACGQRVAGSGVAASCASLGDGSRGLAVKVLQKALGVAVDGADGPQTTAALQAAQRAKKLPATGVTDAATWKALGRAGTPVCTSGSPGATGAPAPSAPSAPTPKPPADAAAQARVAAQTAQLAAALRQKPGASKNKLALAAMAFSMRQLGKPYAYGATGPASYDCSGLVMSSYAHAALTIPRVAAGQYATGGAKVPLDHAKQGDLLFYASDLTKPATVFHVVMYVGNGNVISAPQTGETVKIQPLWTTGLLPEVVRPVTSVTVPLSPGATGPSVVQLQQALNRHHAGLTVDGGYGPSVEAAVRSWQAKKSLPVTGVANVTTWLSLG